MAARTSAKGNDQSWAQVATRPAPPRQVSVSTTDQRGAASADDDADHHMASSSARDDDGFQEVVGRRGRKGGTSATAATSGREDAQMDGQQAAAQGAQRAMGSDSGADMGEEGGGDGDGQPTAADLQKSWHDEIALVKRLRGQGLAEEHPAMRAACQARDAAEQAWRDTKEPAPVSIRLGRAQGKLDRAIALQADARGAMLEEEKGHRERMQALQADLDECTERVRLRRRQLQEIQKEVGTRGSGDGEVQRAQRDAIRKVHSTICGEVGPTIAALVDQLDSGAPAWTALNGLLGKLQESRDALESVSAAPADQFDIGDHDGEQEDNWSSWSESHDVQGQPWGSGGATDGGAQGDGGDAAMDLVDEDGRHDSGDARYGGYGNWGCAPRGHGGQDQDMGSGEWWDSPSRRWGGASRWHASGHGKWSRASWADQLEEEGDGAGEGTEPPPAARRRLDATDTRQETGGDSQQQQPRPPQPATAGGRVEDASGRDPAEASRRHAERVNSIVTQAIEAGVTPLTAKGEELIMLDATQLEAWVAECLPAALL